MPAVRRSRMPPTTRRTRVSPPRPKKSSVGNVILSAAFAVVVFVMMHNFRVLSSLRREKSAAARQQIEAEVYSPSQQHHTPTPLDDDSIHTFIVWTYPSLPQVTDETPLSEDELFLCSYPPCSRSIPSQRLNLRELTRNTTFSKFVSSHAHYKTLQSQQDYLHHVQAVALISLIRRYPTKCAKTWGSSQVVCGNDFQKYAQYDPTSSKLPLDSLPTLQQQSQHDSFHVLSYDSKIKLVKEANMEDELLTLAAAQFMPSITSFVDRDDGLTQVKGHLIASARFRTLFALPKASLTDIWETTFPSIQLRYDAKQTFEKHLFLWKGYTEKSGAMGAEDVATLEYLQELDVKSYLALSFTLMSVLGQSLGENRNRTVIVDVKPGLLPPRVEKSAITLQRTTTESVRAKRLEYAQEILDTFSQQAHVVITSRIQMALPAMAMGIPVIYVGLKDYLQANGVGDMFHVFDPYNGDTWKFDLRAKAKPLSTLHGAHFADRARASFWNVLKRESPLYANTAYLYGMVPLQRLGTKVKDETELHSLFHFIFSTPTLTWREKRAIEHVFYFHPNAQVIVHSNTLIQGDCPMLDVFSEAGYDLKIQTYDLSLLLKATASDQKLVDSFVSQLHEFEQGEHWYSHQTDILRYMLLWHTGGVYLDTDVHLVKSLPRDKLKNVVAYQDPKHDYVSGAVMIFEPKHKLLQAALQYTLQNYADKRSEWPILGSTLMTDLSKQEEYKDTFQVLDDASFYPIDWESIDKCFTHELANLDLSQTYAVHLNTKITSHYTETTKGTFCDKLLHTYCIFCDEIHTIKGTVVQVENEEVKETGIEEEHRAFQGFADLGEHQYDERPVFHSTFDNDYNSMPAEEKKPSLLSRVVSSLFGLGRKRSHQQKYIPYSDRKVLPPVYMEFVKEEEA